MHRERIDDSGGEGRLIVAVRLPAWVSDDNSIGRNAAEVTARRCVYIDIIAIHGTSSWKRAPPKAKETFPNSQRSRKVIALTFGNLEMQGPGLPSFDQLRVFLTVVETGSFAAAGRKLRRATSAVSYAIANLEQQLGVALFDRERAKKPTLTEAGMAVLSEARNVAVGIDNLRAKVAGLMTGLEAEVSLVVDAMMPPSRLVDALQAFGGKFPNVGLRLHVEILGTVSQLVHTGAVDIGIDGPQQFEVPGIEQILVGGVDIIPVAAPSHPLAAAKRNAPGATRNHVQLVLIDRSDLTKGRDFGVFSVKTWRLADLHSKHALLLAGVGWGGMPEPMVRDDVAAGRLKRLELPEGGGGFYGFRALHRTDSPPGPAAAWIIRRFREQAEAELGTPVRASVDAKEPSGPVVNRQASAKKNRT